MYKYLFRIVLGVMGLVEMLAIGVVSAEYSQVINITGTNGDIIQSFEQKWEDLEVYFLDDAGKVNHYTMMDRNMGATEIYNGDFSTGGINTGSFGYHYQWGNNYGFAPCIATGESCDTFPNGETTTNTRVPKSVWMLYVPSNYANNKWNRNDPRMESSVENYQNNDNLWGGSGDAGYNHLTGNIIDRRGPCPNGYYVPSISNLRTLLGSRNKYSSIKSGNQFASDLLLPPAGNRRYGRGRVENQGKVGVYLSSSPEATKVMGIGSVTCGIRIDKEKAFIKYPNAREDLSLADRGIGRGDGNSVRCFKGTENNNYNIYGNGGTGAVIIIHRNKVLALSNPMNRTGFFVGWYDANEGGNEVKKGDTAPRNLYARWDCYEGYELSGGQCMPKRYKIEYELNGGELDELIEEYTIESDDISLKDPLKSGYIFIGRSGTSIQGVIGAVTIPTGSTGNRSYEANWDAIIYTITYELDGGTNNPDNVTGYTIESDITFKDPTKDGYNFDGWFTDVQFTTGITAIPVGTTGSITIYAKWTENKKPSGGSSGGGGGGGGGSSITTNDGQNETSKNDVSTGATIKEPETNTGSDAQTGSQQPLSPTDSSPDREQTVTPLIGGDGEARGGGTQTYTQEFQEAYEFAKGNGITTMPTIQKANMDGKLTRIAMAKMLSQYAINVLGQKPANIITPKFNDVTDKQNSDYDDGVTLAYQLGIMGQNMPNNKFRPDDEVTRAEFATALSRMAYGTSDGEYKGTAKYYIHHMEKLVREGIITNDDPNMKELRGYVMIMLMRSSK